MSKSHFALLACLGASLALAACKTPAAVVTGSVSGGGVSITGAPAPGLHAGYLQTEVHITPVQDAKGDVIKLRDNCDVETGLNTYAILNGQAAASSSVASGPASSIAINRGSMTGRAAVLVALGGGQAPTPEAIQSLGDCSKATKPGPASPPG